jgi:hypothetical protein
VQRPGAKDESERPIVNPVTGGALCRGGHCSTLSRGLPNLC